MTAQWDQPQGMGRGVFVVSRRPPAAAAHAGAPTRPRSDRLAPMRRSRPRCSPKATARARRPRSRCEHGVVKPNGPESCHETTRGSPAGACLPSSPLRPRFERRPRASRAVGARTEQGRPHPMSGGPGAFAGLCGAKNESSKDRRGEDRAAATNARIARHGAPVPADGPMRSRRGTRDTRRAAPPGPLGYLALSWERPRQTLASNVVVLTRRDGCAARSG